MAPNHGGDPPGVHLRANGGPLGPKIGQNRQKLPCPKIRNFYYSARSSIWAKNRIYGYGAKSRWGPPWGLSSGQWGPIGANNWSKPSKITMPQNSNFLLLRGHLFGQKFEFKVMAPNHSRDPLGSILGPMGSHWGKKMGQNRKKLPCLEIRIFDYSAVIDLSKISNLRLWRQITVRTP